FFVGAARAASPAQDASGYVVKVETSGVFLDLGAQSGAVTGQLFTVYTEGPELIHPKTGKSLGREQTKIAEGTIREVFELYSVGTLSPGAANVSQGMRAKPGALPPPPPKAAAAPSAAAASGRQPRWKSP